MIFCFSGTGNSLHAARHIAISLTDCLLMIPKEYDALDTAPAYDFKEGDVLGFAFPVHAWGPPKIVLDFIARMKITGVKPYVFSLSTCGGEEGRTASTVRRALEAKGLALSAAFSIVMPNNYMLGIDVDTPQVEADKLRQADELLDKYCEVIRRRQTGMFFTVPGSLPGIKSTLINPFFNRFAMDTKRFYATDKCDACGLCQRVCPVHSIVVDTKPSWKKQCTHCLACIARCPKGAIEYGKGTVGRRRYVHPGLRTADVT
jgi:NAD-dependent dihydropyrimidine dehydrogenase PreA subunit